MAVIEYVQVNELAAGAMMKAPGTLTEAERDALLQHLVLQVNAVAGWQSDLTQIVGQVMGNAKDNPMFAMLLGG